MVSKKLFSKPLFLTVLSLFAFAGGVSAEGAASDPVYVIDMQRVINESAIGKAARTKIEEEIKKKQLVMEKSRIEFDKARQDLEKQASLLSPQALGDKQQALQKKQRDLERQYQDIKEEIARRNQESMIRVVNKIDEIVADLAAKNGYKFVLERDTGVVVFVNQKYDISEQVIKELNTRKSVL